MPTGSCKRFTFTPFIGTTDVSCNHIAPNHNVIADAREWYDITPLSSVPIFHRLREKNLDTNSIFFKETTPDVYLADGRRTIYRRTMGDFALNYNDFVSANWFHIGKYYRGLPHFYQVLIRIAVYIGIVIFVWKIIIRPIIGPSGVLIHTDSLRDEVFHESFLKTFFNMINALKVPKKVGIRVKDTKIPQMFAVNALNR